MSGSFGSASCFSFSCLCFPRAKMLEDEAARVPVKKVPRDERILFLKEVFFHEFSKPANFFVKVPGRVNLIGEHIDYCGFPVLPMALEQDIVFACGKRYKKKLNIKNVNESYPAYSMDIEDVEDIIIKPDANGKPYWYNYILCGIKGALEYLGNVFDFGLDILVDGNIPPASGLSSSSALVSAACAAFLHLNKGRLITKVDIAALCAASERYVGTQGGGMDQAIAFLAEKNSAQYITFLPLQATPVYLPDNAAFVVAHSLAEANKAANNEFNSRVVECRLAAKIIATLAEIEIGSRLITLSQLQDGRDSSFEDMVKLVHKCLPQDNYTKSEICDILNTTEDELSDSYLTSNTKHLNNFKLKQRALHVYEEASRVENFRKLCSESSCANDNIISTLGNLMAQSHESLKTLYECSHEKLDMLVELSKKFGVNARLTGAGWGGCIVAICREEEVNEYIDFITDEYYVKHCKITKQEAASRIFATAPNDGAVVYQDCCL